jgi:hypothetical protein
MLLLKFEHIPEPLATTDRGAASGRLPPGFALSKDVHIAANDAKNALNKGYMNTSKVFRINVMLVRDASAPLMLLAIRVATVALALAFA